jgi:hypothetical protein
MKHLILAAALLIPALAPDAVAGPAKDAETRVCHYLMTDGECRIYQDRLVNAHGKEELTALLAEYSRLIEERQQLCGGHPGVAYIDYTAPQYAAVSQ